MELVTRICAVGEAMLELSAKGEGWALGYGGDTFNTAAHLARYGRAVSYFTALGEDPFSQDLISRWAGEGISTDLVLRDPQRAPGLYAISTDERGERSFTYWRKDSAARRMFRLPGARAAIEAASTSNVLVYSLITLAILPPRSRRALFDLCVRVRAAGGQVVFDGNYRPRLWRNASEARAARDQALEICDLGLPTLEDEALLDGAQSPEAVARTWRDRGAKEVVVKMGAKGCLASDGQLYPPGAVLDPVDTSGAGDAFNAGYLNARLQGAHPKDAAREGHRLAAWVIMRRGAVPSNDAVAPYGAAPIRD